MKLTKEDYMKLPKERLAELLVERDAQEELNKAIQPAPTVAPYIPSYPYRPWWEDMHYLVTCQS